MLALALLTQQTAIPERVWPTALIYFFVLLGLLLGAVMVMRRVFRAGREAQNAPQRSGPATNDSPAFLTASMQGVIQKLREQEKELERLHKAEKERAEQTERLSEEVTRNMPAGLLLVNAMGIISSVNPAAEQVLGMRGLAFRRYSEALGEESALTQLIGECLNKGTIHRREQVQHVTPQGETRTLGVTISFTRRNEKITGAICLLSDLTELASLQHQMQLRENLAALGELSAGIAHEFKNALATISGYAQMIRGEKTEGEAAEYAGLILEQTRNITHVVSEFLKYARPIEIPQEPVALDAVIERIVAELQESLPGVRIAAEGSFEQVTGEEGFLRQALLNLARNAAEAAAEASGGGQVAIEGRVSAGAEGPAQQIIVRDNGPGIPAEALGKIFVPFFTTKAGGTGLGLAVVQKIIVQHGGTVQARNRPEGGAEFIVTLPVFRAAAEAIESKQARI
ncbi:MAG: PAS domain S-box protein [Acidobacteriia bacterium]|nr:PAS domain S-box protein [Terriglobia bacterium]